MRRLTILAIVLLSAASSRSAAQQPVPVAPTAQQLVEHNLEARGGAERWREVRTLELEGAYDAWSDPVEMTIQRARPTSYRFDFELFGGPAALAFDGTTAWVSGAGFDVAEGTPIEDSWKRNVEEDAAFVSRLQQLAEAGAKMEVLGRGDVDGTPAWKLRVEPQGAPPEVWYLDAESGLELERESTTFDVFSGAIEMPMQTYYMDFRTVDGLKVPFREERHFGTRYHLYEVREVKVNPTIEPTRFEVPKRSKETPEEPG